MIFVDWLSIYQDFPGQNIPILASEIKTTVCALTGAILYESVKGYSHPGSYDSNILIKFDGIRLMMSGNPSAWNRKDNLFGVESVQDAVAVYNSILRGLGYPEFFASEDTYLTSRPYQSSEKYHHDQAHITRVDLTENFNSCTNAADTLRYLSQYSYRGQCGYLYPNGRTVDWMGDRNGDVGGSKRIYWKYYDKAFDIERKLKKLYRIKRNFKHKCPIETYEAIDDDGNTIFIPLPVDFNALKAQNELNEQIKYLEKLLIFLIENNTIRFELELKSKTLTELGLDTIQSWTLEKMIIQIDKYRLHDKQKIHFNNKIDLYGQLLDAGVTSTRAKQAAILGQSWLDGHDINYRTNPIIKKSNFYKVRADLLLIGFNIDYPLNVSNFPCKVQTLKLQSLQAPDWYEMPGKVA